MMSHKNTLPWFSLLSIPILISLSSCTLYDDDYYSLWNNGRSPSEYRGSYQHHPNNNVASTTHNKRSGSQRTRGSGGVRVPDSYHFSETATPASHKNRDTSWVRSQNPSNYTIELDSGEKPAEVADTLYKTPKSTRKAQVKQNKNGKTVYTGVYGSFEDEEQARRALEDLPEDVRSKAKVQRWENVQEKTDAPQPKPPTVTAPEDETPHSVLPPERDPPIYPIY